MRVIPAVHGEGWQGPLDEHRQELVTPPDYNAKKRRAKLPWTAQRGKRVATVHAMGTVGAFDGQTIAWRSGVVWKRRKADPRSPEKNRDLEPPSFSPQHMRHDEFIM
eukprot:TRINITY_DN8205_c0_g4_i3.p4 TRINITY_DN8205_c0_g4~~TRINITY_DN8205_c0_g4_i3.p4  ORF type:complete len:107 (+),score=39.05 TRINITY_DN8205_c0_g4_i3:602-922(+)